VTANQNVSILCYFKNGKKQKGPYLLSNFKEKSVKIRGKTWEADGKRYHNKALIKVNGYSKTEFFVDDILEWEVPYIEPFMLDWILFQKPEYLDRDLRISLVEISLGEFKLGARLKNRIHGRCIHIENLGCITLGNNNDGALAVGNYI
jgi:hypothetical protein